VEIEMWFVGGDVGADDEDVGGDRDGDVGGDEIWVEMWA
jgi:hypothetical protein